jgi:tryptophan-rich sensory protein
MAVVFLLLGGVTIAVVQALGYQGPLVRLSMVESTAIMSGMLFFSGVLGAVAGYLAAWLDSRAPLVTATTFGVLILLFQFVARHAFAAPLLSPYPAWYLTGAPVLAFVGTIVGGILRVRASGPPSVAT